MQLIIPVSKLPKRNPMAIKAKLAQKFSSMEIQLTKSS
jgi:hypothetical protein